MENKERRDYEMKKGLPHIAILVGVVSVIVGAISRIMLVPIIVPSRVYAGFAALCFLFAIALSLQKQQ